MKAAIRAQTGFALAVLLLANSAAVHASVLTAARRRDEPTDSPIFQVLKLITNLKEEVEGDGEKEQQSFDQYQCWCEATLGRKAKDISTGKEFISKAEKSMVELKGAIASHGAEIAQLNKDSASNKASQEEATEIREKERTGYDDEKAESEQCMGALESAITVLTGAGEKKAGFLGFAPSAQLLTVAADMKRVLHTDLAWHAASASDLKALQDFVATPEKAFEARRTEGLSAAQVGANPFGDYAPQSTQIQGILKSMYDSFASDLEKSNAEEATKQKAYDELMATKRAELATLETTLQNQETQKADKSKRLTDTDTAHEDAQKQLKADEETFETTKSSCKETARDWVERSRLRTEELTGINTAINILSSPEALETFKSASETFLQLSAAPSHTGKKPAAAAARHVYSALQRIASKYKNLDLARIAVELKVAGPFDKVIGMIDGMIKLIRKEEADDIAHRDRCQNAGGKNSNDIEDLQAYKTKVEEKIEELEAQEGDTKDLVEKIEGQMEDTKGELKDRLKLRNEEREDFEKAVKDDTDALALLRKAMTFLSDFYKRNKKSLVQVRKAGEPEYTVDPDQAPDVAWKKGGYKAKTGGVLSIMSSLVSDLEGEIPNARRRDKEAQKEYEKDRGVMMKELKAQKESHVNAKTELADIREKLTEEKNNKESAESELAQEGDLKASITKDCAWVKSHFDARNDQRKDELDALSEAKGILAGGA